MNIEYPTADRLGALQALWQEAFGDDAAFIQQFFSSAYSPSRCRCATVGDPLAAALYWFDCRGEHGKIAYLYAVATAKAFRGAGLCRALMEDTHRLLKALGYVGAVLVPGETELFAMYEKMGYNALPCLDSFTCTAAGTAEIHTASIEEYASVRRRLLPQGGILQEGENLRCLAGYAELYTGADFCLAAIRDDSQLQGLELLGNAAAAPGILGALGLERGTFRIPGQKSFAMYHALTDAPAPAYFGLAFD